MTDRSVGPRCGNNPNFKMSDGDRKAVDDFKARLALQADAKPYIERAVWVDFDPLMEVIASTLWEHCARDDEDMPQAVCDDPRTIAAFAAAVARAHAASPAPATDQAALRDRIAEVPDEPQAALRVRVLREILGRIEGTGTEDSAAEEVGAAQVVAVLKGLLADVLLPAPADRAAACICGHTEAQHFEDACLVCDCGDYLVPEAAREVIARWKTAALQTRADRATVLREVGWTECSPEWLAAHPGECGTAPRVPGGPDVSHWHPQAAELRRMADETPQPETDDCCGGVPPELFIDEAGREWHAGDCWCTLAPGHGGQHRCQPCTDRVGAPGWTDEQPAVGAQQPKEAVWCSAVALRVHHAGHDWTSHPGMDPVHCVGYPQPKEA